MLDQDSLNQLDARYELKNQVFLIPEGDTTPSVPRSGTYKTQNRQTTIITDFIGGYEGEIFRLFVDDSYTRIQESWQLTLKWELYLNSPMLLDREDCITFIRYGGVWKEIDRDLKNEILWDDLSIPGMVTRAGATAPDLEPFGPGPGLLRFFAFDGGITMEQVFFSIQIPHRYKPGTNLLPHIHWSPTTNDAGNVVWQLEYTWANIASIHIPSITINAIGAAGGTAWVHNKTYFQTIPGFEAGVQKQISAIMVCRLFRDPTHGSDNYGHDASLMGFDFHYQIDIPGSRQERIK